MSNPDLAHSSLPRSVSTTRLKWVLYLNCVLTDFAAFVVVFAVTRSLAEGQAEPWYLGIAGAGLSFSAGVGSVLGGLLAHRFDGRVIFLTGAVIISLSVAACGLADPHSPRFLPDYWLLGIGLGFLYPPLIGWLNQGEDAHANRRGVSRTLILFCVAWNLGMMCGQLTAGSLFALGAHWTYGAAFSAALVNLFLAVAAVRRVVPISAALNDVSPQENEAVERAAAFKRLSWIANMGGMFGGSMVIHLLPGLAVSIGVPPDDHGMLLASWRAVIVGTYVLMHYVAFWHYRLSTSLTSQVLAASGLVVIARAESAVTLLLGLALLGQLVGYNYFSGLFYSTAGSSNERRALAAGIHEATLAAGMAFGTIAGGILGSLVNHRMPYLLAAGVMLALMVVQAAAWWRWVPGAQGQE
jgi:MFS family permease